ncbi:type VI secretion system baseplate subunit TssF [Sapientia aquatica]|uniref:Type VI secretion system baseplate subunit TssF n=1 Tax=Sapientia aquatica TaxID=1549640 RepID=A0A4R5VRY2_9BURK|nr:type VI secretion system baseplate subunit TssF [Sapientia aquatica]TDK61300.1 type VI secretion system baseplate subunit TssF [Sapientia aquatica]
MDPLLLEYYNRELIYMREMANEFAHMHPKIAKRLGIHGIEVADPYVERLIEAFSFISARTQIKLDAEFPRFTQRLLEVIYPNYICPTPSMAVAQLHPNPQEGDLRNGFVVPKQTAFHAAVAQGEQTACEFRSSQDVTLWPIEIVDAKLTGAPPDLPNIERYLPEHIEVRGALRLTLRLTEALNFSDLNGLDTLPIYLCGDEVIASHIFELLHTSVIATVTPIAEELMRPHIVLQDALVHEGLEPNQSLLPLNWNTSHGNNLLHEYFSCPSRFYFFSLTQLKDGLKRIYNQQIEIIVLLDRSPMNLISHVDHNHFALYCTPVINLFPGRADRVEVNSAETEFHVVPNRSKPIDFEIFSLTEVSAQATESSANVIFRPMFQTLNQDQNNYGRYYSLRRERRLTSDSARKYGTRSPYMGTEVFISIVDQHEAPYSEDIKYLSIQAMLTNRDLATMVPRNGVSDLTTSDSIPVASVGLIRPPSAAKAPYAEREHAWRLIRQLGFNYLPLTDMDGKDGGRALQDLLRLFVTSEDSEQQRQIQSLIRSDIIPITRRLPGKGPLIYGRGVKCQLTVDETGFSGTSPYLFGLILEHWLAHHVSINVFTQTELLTIQRGKIATWPVRMGGRGII